MQRNCIVAKIMKKPIANLCVRIFWWFNQLFLNSQNKKLKPSDFKEGEIWQFGVASRSHVKKPYYVIIKSVGNDFIETSVPGRHSLKIALGSPEWKYHIPRMKFVSDYSEDKSVLLYNQQSLEGIGWNK